MSQPQSNQSYEILMDIGVGRDTMAWRQPQESEEWLSLALEAASMGAWDKNLLTGEEAWSAQSQVLFGFEPGTFDGNTTTFLSRVHPDDRDAVWRSHNQALQTGRYRAEFRVIHPDATMRWIVARGKILYTPSGDPMRLIGVHIDLTERKQTEAMLRQKEVPYRRIFETITDGLMIIDLETSILVETNLATCQMHGYSYDELIGALPTAYVHPDSFPLFGEFVVAIQAGKQFHCQARDVRKDGTCFDVEVTGTLLDYNGKPHALAIVRDISERKRLEADRKQAQVALQEALQEAEYQSQLLRHVIDASPDWIFVKDQNFQFILANRSFANAIGKSIEETLGKNDLELGFPETLVFGDPATGTRGFRTDDIAVLAGEVINNPSHPVTVADGTSYFLETQKLPLQDSNGHRFGILGVARDVTTHRQTQKALQHSEETNRAFVRAIPDLMIRMSKDGTYLDFILSKQLKVHLGGTELQGKNIFEILPVDLAQERMHYVEKALQTGETQIYEHQFLANGEIQTEEIRITICGEDEVLVIVRDVSDRKQAEVALAESEAKFRRMIENASDLIYAMSAEGYITYLSPQFTHLFGYEISEFLGQSFVPLVHPDDLPIAAAAVQRLFETGENQTGTEFRHKCKDGSWRWVTCNSTPIIDAHGKVVGFQGIARDISEAKRLEVERQAAEESLRRNHAILQAQREATLDGILVIDEHRNVASYNQRFQTIWQIPQSIIDTNDDRQLLGTVLSQLKDPEEFLTKVEYLYQNPQEITYEEIALQDGRTLERYSAPVLSPKGEYYGRVWYFRDISAAKQMEAERRATEEKLKHQEQTLRAIVDNASCWIWMTDPKGKMLLVNQRFCQDVGLPESTLTSVAHYSEALGIEASRGCMQSDTLCLNSDRPIQVNETLQLVDGQLHAMEVIKTKLKEPSGEVTGLIGIAVDVTQQKQTEATLRDREQQLQQKAQDLETMLTELHHTQMQLIQSEKMSSLGQLVAGVAHEINNPVNFIYGNLTHANEYTQDLITLLNLYQEQYPTSTPAIQAKAHAVDLDFLTEDLPKLLSSMKVGADRIRQIVASLRNFSRMDEAEFKTVDIHEGLDSTLMILQNRLKAQPQQPEVEVIKEYADLPLIECYAGQLNQVFMNILSNALDALEEQRAQHYQKIEPVPSIIHICTEMPNPEQVVIRFKDNGPGIPEALQKRLFDPFFTTKPVGKGTGMGLSISYQIVTEKHNGSLQCISLPNQGAEFVITIPIRQQIP